MGAQRTAVRAPRPIVAARRAAIAADEAGNGEPAAAIAGNAATTAGLGGAGGGMPLELLSALAGTAGNRAVAGLVTAQRQSATLAAQDPGAPAAGTVPGPAPPNPYEALDDPDFNAGQITNDLLRAINQSEHTYRTKPSDGGFAMQEDVEAERRSIDVPKVIEVLSNRSASQIAEVRRRYQADEGRPLETDLFGLGQSGRKPNITADQQARIEALLKGTKADPIAAPLQLELSTYPPAVAAQLRRAIGDKNDAAAKKNQIEADTIEIHELFSKELSDASREQIMALHRRPVDELDAIYGVYAFRYGEGQAVYDITLRLGENGLQRMRLDELRLGNIAQADAIAIEDKRRRIEALNKADEKYSKDTLGKLAASTWQGRSELDEHEKQRRALTADIEGIIDLNKREAMKEAGGKAAGVAVAARLQKILGQQDGEIGNTVGSELARTLGKEHAQAITAAADPWVSSGSESLVTAAAFELKAMERDHTTKAPRIIATLRSFPGLAQHDILARVRDPSVSAEEKERIGADPRSAVRSLAHRYTDLYRDEYDRIRDGGRTYDEIVASAGEADRTLMEDLRLGGGETSDLAELQHAMGKKDVDAVKAILKRQPNREKIEALVAGYNSLSGGHDLRHELFGADPEGNVNVALAESGAAKMFGEAMLSGRDAAQVDELLRKPTAEQLSGKATAGFLGVPRKPGQPEIDWAAAGAEEEYQVTMANRGVTGHVREWGGDPETEKILKKTRAGIPDLVKQWNEAKDPALKAHLRSEILKSRATLSGDADAYEKDNARALASFQSALQFAVSIALAVAIPGAGPGLVAFLETTALNIAANVASNFVIKGGDYHWDDLKADVLGGVLGAAGGKFGEEVLGKVAQKAFGPAAKATTETASNLGIESALANETAKLATSAEKAVIGVEEFETREAGQAAAKAVTEGEEKAAQEATKAASEGGDLAAAEGRATAAEGRATAAEGRAAGEGAAAEGAAAGGAGTAAAAAPAMTAAEKWAREIGSFFGGMEAPKALTGDYGLTLEEVLKNLVTLGAGKAANRHRESVAARKAAAAREKAAGAQENVAAAEAGNEGAAMKQGADEPARATDEPVRDTESEQLAREGQEELTPGEDGAPRTTAAAAPEPSPLNVDAFGPRASGEMLLDNGIQPDSAQALQALANDRNLVIKARPTNVASLPTVTRVAPEGGGKPTAPGLPKPEMIKAKSLNRVDMLIGGPAGQEGKIGFFEPRLPSREILEAMTPEARKAVEDRAAQRQEEYDHHKEEYSALAAEGLIRVKDGVLQVADPRTVATAEAPRGQFKDVGGDIDIYDITHADGSKLTADERAAVTRLMRSMGIDVEHGFHTAWAEDSPDTYSQAGDEKIRAEHTDKTPLVAFVPLTPPRQVWANDVVVGPQRTEGPGDRHMPLKGARVVGPREEPPAGAPGTGPDVKPGEANFGDVMPGEPRKQPEGPGPQAPEEPVQGSDGPAPGHKGPVIEEIESGLLPEESALQLEDARNATRHREIFEGMIVEDSTREVGLYRNPITGEYLIVQGGPQGVSVEKVKGKGKGPAEGGKAQRWKELLNAGSDVGHWELVAHNHPSGRSYPSVADFRTIIEASMRDGLPRESRIVVRTPKGLAEATFAFEPGNNEPYVVRPLDEPPLRFATAEEYRNFLEHRFAQEGGEIPQWVRDYELQIAEKRRQK